MKQCVLDRWVYRYLKIDTPRMTKIKRILSKKRTDF